MEKLRMSECRKCPMDNCATTHENEQLCCSCSNRFDVCIGCQKRFEGKMNQSCDSCEMSDVYMTTIKIHCQMCDEDHYYCNDCLDHIKEIVESSKR